MYTQQKLLDGIIKQLPAIADQREQILEKVQNDNIHVIDQLYNLLHSSDKMTEAQLRGAIAAACNCESLEFLPTEILRLTKKYIPLGFARIQQIAIFEETDNLIKVATARPDNEEALDALKKKVRKPMQVYFAFSYQIIDRLKDKQTNFKEKVKNLQAGALSDLQSIESLKNSSKLLDTILIRSLDSNASDIHIEPHNDRGIIRFRVDGELKDIAEVPSDLAEVITSRIKVMADLRIDEHHKPQDGRFKLDLTDNSTITARVSILPVYEGEKVVMRILTEKNQKVELKDLGYTDENQGIIYNNADKAHGMLLVTGPTGSGKTTTLYTLLKLLNKTDVNLMTVEDPIEYRLDRVNQIQVNPVAGLTFASGLRSILRQDPDVVMVGEIRDEETASIAVNASLTGHLVLATLHTNSAIDTLPRLLEMGVESYLVASTVNVVVAQRLLRKLCDECKQEVQLTPEVMAAITDGGTNFEQELQANVEKLIPMGASIYKAQGCDKCGQSGYAGRIAIAEVLDVDDSITELLFQKASPQEILAQAKENGFKLLLEDGVIKVGEGRTSMEEIIRVLKD